MIAVGFDADCDRITISNAGLTYAPRSIGLTRTGNSFALRVRGQEIDLIAADFSAFTDAGGRHFTDPDTCAVYLAEILTRHAFSGDRYVVPIAITARGQTLIPLPAPPTSPVRIEVNGSVYRVPDIAVSALAVTWLYPDFQLDPSDSVTVLYS